MSGPVRDNLSASQEQVVDAILLAIKHCPAGKLYAPALLRVALQQSWEEVMPRPGGISLSGLWSILERQPGVTFDSAAPALARLKTWEPFFHLVVEIPSQLALHGVVELARMANRCPVTDAHVAQVLPHAARALVVFSNSKLKPVRNKVLKPVDPLREIPLARRLAGLMLLVVLVVGGGGAWGYHWYFHLRAVELDAATISDEIPIGQAVRQGSTVTLTLRERTWMTFDAAEREDQLQRALTRLAPLGIQVLVLQDEAAVELARVEKSAPAPAAQLTAHDSGAEAQ